MSQENVEIVRRVYEPLNQGDWEGVFSDADPDFEFTTQRGVTAGTHRGPEAARKQMEELFSPFESWTVKPEEFFERGDHVVVFVRVRSRPIGSSSDIEVRNGHLWTLRDGTVRSLKTFPVREEALEAVGLSE